MAMGGGGSTYRSADGIWHAAIDIEPDRATGRRRRLTAQGKTKAVANTRLRMKLDAYVRKGLTPNSPSPRLMERKKRLGRTYFLSAPFNSPGSSDSSVSAQDIAG